MALIEFSDEEIAVAIKRSYGFDDTAKVSFHASITADNELTNIRARVDGPLINNQPATPNRTVASVAK